MRVFVCILLQKCRGNIWSGNPSLIKGGNRVRAVERLVRHAEIVVVHDTEQVGGVAKYFD